MPRERSIAFRILLPVLLVAGVTFAAMLLLASRAASNVRDDYDRLAIDAAASHVTTLLDLAVSELTAATLQENPVVVEAKKESVVGAIRRAWTGARLDGVIVADDGAVVTSTLGQVETRAVVAERTDGFFVVEAPGSRLRCLAEPFPLWHWTVITLGRRSFIQELRPELAFLLPMLTLLAVVMIAGVLFVLWRNLRRPVARMVAEVESDGEVRPTGLSELDHIGAAVTSAMGRLRARTAELHAELDRRREAEHAIQEREGRIRLLMNSTAEGIFGMDASGVCTFCNPAAVRILGLTRQDDLLGKDIHELVHHARPGGSPYPPEECPMRLTALSGKAARVTEDVFWRKDGTSFPVEYWSYPMTEDGALRGAVVGFVDTTDRTALEQQLRQSQKMEAVGRLAGGIAHDFNNMLMAIVGHATLAREGLGEGSAARGDLDQVLSAADKAAGLTRQILAFSRKQPVRLAPVDLNDVVTGMGKVLGRLLGEDVEVEYRLAPGELVTLADRGQIEQVLLNLWSNARDAMPGGGRLVIGTRAADCDAVASAEIGLAAPGPYAVLTVADTGAGMDEPTRQRALEPFFTTKEAGKGTGLGLAIAYGIVQQHRGQIGISSAPGRGTTVTIHLPLVPRPVTRPSAPASVDPRGGDETVLLAEDNEQVRTLARTVLEGAGYRVLAASNGEEAVGLHEAHAQEIALCLFDVVMPRLGGLAALEAIRRRHPGVRALLMSGYAPDLTALEGVTLLVKPFVPRELLRGVREALDG